MKNLTEESDGFKNVKYPYRNLLILLALVITNFHFVEPFDIMFLFLRGELEILISSQSESQIKQFIYNLNYDEMKICLKRTQPCDEKYWKMF